MMPAARLILLPLIEAGEAGIVVGKVVPTTGLKMTVSGVEPLSGDLQWLYSLACSDRRAPVTRCLLLLQAHKHGIFRIFIRFDGDLGPEIIRQVIQPAPC